MEKLFAEIKVEDYFDKILSLINHEIDNYSQQTMEAMDIEIIAEQLFHLFSTPVPKLIKENTKSFITAEASSDTSISDVGNPGSGEKQVMDIANYTIPFSGPPIFFKCIPRTSSGKYIEATVYNGEILIQINSKGQMIGNEGIQAQISDQFIDRLHQIEETLSLLQDDLDHYSGSLKSQIYKQLCARLVPQSQ